MTKQRENFSAVTVDIIAKRAAYRCSFPGCGRLLIGPGAGSNDVANQGQCAHIYSAAENGPRGRAGLSPEALTSSDNGIFLCQQHHKLIDSKSGSNKYPASVLLYYKALHEYSISQEIGSLQYPMLWITSIKIIKAPYLASGQVLNFARSNILCGDNGTGKSLIIELIYCVLTGKCIRRFENKDIELEIRLSNSVFSKVICSINNNKVIYRIDNNLLSFCPFNIDVIHIHECERNSSKERDDIDYMCRFTNLNREQVKAIIESTDIPNGSIADLLQLHTIRRNPYEKTEISVRRCDFPHKTKEHLWLFGQLSQTEQSRIMIELLINHLRTVSRYRPIMLLYDSSEFYIYDESTQKQYLDILQENSSHFQTVMSSLKNKRNIALSFPGWNTIVLQ